MLLQVLVVCSLLLLGTSHSLLVHSHFGGYSDCLQVLAIMSKLAINILTPVISHTYIFFISFGSIPGG